MGDFKTILWISEYLHRSIHVSNKSNGRIIVKIEQENALTPLNLVYGNNHFELFKRNYKYSYSYLL
jgi:hypothetical protein